MFYSAVKAAVHLCSLIWLVASAAVFMKLGLYITIFLAPPPFCLAPSREQIPAVVDRTGGEQSFTCQSAGSVQSDKANKSGRAKAKSENNRQCHKNTKYDETQGNCWNNRTKKNCHRDWGTNKLNTLRGLRLTRKEVR